MSINPYDLKNGLSGVVEGLKEIAKGLAAQEHLTYNVIVNVSPGTSTEEIAKAVQAAIAEGLVHRNGPLR